MNLVLNALVPVFGIMIFGAAAKKLKLVGPHSENIIAGYVINCALPSIMFISVAETPSNELFVPIFLLGIIVVIILSYGLTFLVSYYKTKSAEMSAMKAVIVTFPNVSFMGIPVTMALFGNRALIPLITINILMMFVLSITVVLINAGRKNSNTSISESILIFLKQPFLVGVIAGIVISMLGIQLPAPVANIFSSIGITTGPCALFVLGNSLISFRIKHVTKEVLNMCFLRLIAVPVLTLLVMKILNIPSNIAATTLILLALSPAVANYMISKEEEVYISETSSILITASILSALTLSGFILALPYLWPDITFIS